MWVQVSSLSSDRVIRRGLCFKYAYGNADCGSKEVEGESRIEGNKCVGISFWQRSNMCCEEHNECLSLWLTQNAFEVMQDNRNDEAHGECPVLMNWAHFVYAPWTFTRWSLAWHPSEHNFCLCISPHVQTSRSRLFDVRPIFCTLGVFPQ